MYAAERLGLQAVANNQRVVTQLDGSVWLPNTFTKDFAELLASIGISGHYYMLRHTAATNMLRNGVPPKVVQQQLGHASASFTLDRYGHIDATMQDDAAKKLDDWLRAGKRSTNSAAS